MAPTKSDFGKENDKERITNDVGPQVPDWVTEDYFVDILKDNFTGFKKIHKFEVALTAGDGENYASIMMRIKIQVELLGTAIKDVAYMLKTLPQNEHAQMMIAGMGLFPREQAMYGKYLPEFEQMYLEAGKQITFGPRSFRFKKDPGVQYVLLEDLSPKGFKNANRLEGLDVEHTESVLKLLAAFHAVSVVRRDATPEHDLILEKPMFGEEQREMLDSIGRAISGIFNESLNTYDTGRKYAKRMEQLMGASTDELIKNNKLDPNDFNVLLHGDLWVNNILFRYNEEGKREDSIFIDFQISRYGSPACDLYYFLLSSTKLDIKLAQFDYFVKYYHDNLVQNLRLLQYPKNIPTLRDLRIDLLRKSFFATSTITGVLSAILLDPDKNANIENFMEDGTDGREFKMRLYKNPRYIQHMEAILPWMDLMGIL